MRALRAVQEVLGDPRWKAEVVALGIPAVCARGIAGGWPAHAEALRQAARVLAGVARLSAGREALGKAGALGALAGLLRNSHEEVREAAAEALVAATDARDGAELLAQQPGVIQAVVRLRACCQPRRRCAWLTPTATATAPAAGACSPG